MHYLRKSNCHPGRTSQAQRGTRDPGPTQKHAQVSRWVPALRDRVRSLSLSDKSLGRDDNFVLGAV